MVTQRAYSIDKDPVDTFMLAILGVDGSGKTSTIEELKRRDVLQGAHYVKINELKHAHRLLRKYYPTGPDGVPDYTEGNFARIRPFATAVDVLDNYDRNILPLIGRVKYIVVDRYFLSSIAYFRAMGHHDIAHEYFSKLRHADLTIYLRIDPDILPARYAGRGGAHETEPIDLIRRHSQAMDEVVAEVDCNVVTIENVGRPFEETFALVERTVLEHVDAWNRRHG